MSECENKNCSRPIFGYELYDPGFYLQIFPCSLCDANGYEIWRGTDRNDPIQKEEAQVAIREWYAEAEYAKRERTSGGLGRVFI